MRNINKYLRQIALVSCLLTCFSCEVDEVVDPNNPSLASVLNDASKAELQVLVTGLEARHRAYYASATQMFGSFGRELWAFFASDPRFISHWLGIGVSETYPDFFASAGTYVSPYLAVKQANILIQSAEGSSALTDEEMNGYTGFAKTIKGFQLLYPLLQQGSNGIRVDVEDPLNPGPILGYNEALAEIRNILDDGLSDLQAAGSSFSFGLSSGWDGFDTPTRMAEVNRAIAARAALYAGDFDGALTALSNSFMNLSPTSEEDMWEGPALVYGEAPDINNPLYYPLDAATNTIIIVHPALIEDALPGDARLSKFYQRTDPVINSGLQDAGGNNIPGEYQDARWETNTDPIPFIRNEELILIYAECQARGSSPDVTEAVNAIDVVRNMWGVGNYTGGTTTDELIDEILFQRRYSLWAEAGHRWIDLVRTNRLNSTYVDLRDQGTLFTQVARRTSETNWEESQGN